MNTVEDYLELLVGLQGDDSFDVDKSDKTILQSIGRQVYKGTALTDRQHSLIKDKLLFYKQQFADKGYNVETCLDSLRMPLRKIDRSKYIKLVTTAEVYANTVYETYKSNWLWIKIRFPFNKKNITDLESIKPDTGYHHQKGTHEHNILFTEKNVLNVVEAFKNKSFEIDREILEYYEKVLEISKNPDSYIPGVYNLKLKNLPGNAVASIQDSVGKLSIDTLALYKDRSLLYGLVHFDEADLNKSLLQYSNLSQRVVNRKSNRVFINRASWNLNELVNSIYELNRFPLMVMLDEDHAADQLSELHQAFRNLIDNSAVSVMFRLDNNTPATREFNEYIKDNSLNNPLDKNTKIVYINKNKMPKMIIKDGWAPSTVLSVSSTKTFNKLDVFEVEADLTIHYDSELSPFYNYNRSARIPTIEKI